MYEYNNYERICYFLSILDEKQAISVIKKFLTHVWLYFLKT